MSVQKPIRVMVVDDSAVVRQVMSAVFSREPDMEVVVAQEPLIALRKMNEAMPDVILLDLQMPRMDGLTFLRRIRPHAIPVVICSAFSGANTQAAVRALEYGAIDIVQKPELGLKTFLDESATTLVELVRAAAGSRAAVRRDTEDEDRRGASAPSPDTLSRPRPRWGATTLPSSDRIIAIGASTGGTAALHKVLGAVPSDCPGIVVVQHMPAGFTAAFAQRLDETCRIEVREAKDGDMVCTGTALIAPGNHHLLVQRRGEAYYAQVRGGPAVSRHRPSVNVLFHSVAVAAGTKAVGALLTGMGDDGADGLLELRNVGAPTFAQDEASCVVYGMPKAALACGAVDGVTPLSRMSQALIAAAQAPKH
jgi:two-component system chemotaxis response regulator CheB